MSCPFRHRWASEGDPASTLDANPSPQGDGLHAVHGPSRTAPPCLGSSLNSGFTAPPQTGTCPYLETISKGQEEGGISATTGKEISGNRDNHTRKIEESDDHKTVQAAAKCPLGFGSTDASSKKQIESAWHCMICGSLLFDCVTTTCGHDFCRPCISKTADCPCCGADVGELRSNTTKQDLIDTFIEHHAGDSESWKVIADEPPGDLPALDRLTLTSIEIQHDEPVTKAAAHVMEESAQIRSPDTMATSSQIKSIEGYARRAAFLLHISLQAMSSGNYPSAQARLDLCRKALQSQLDVLRTSNRNNMRKPAPKDMLASEESPSTDSRMSEGIESATRRDERKEISTPHELDVVERLGAVCGCIGDCYRSDGDISSALQEYEEAAAQLRSVVEGRGPASEAAQQLSITLNKIGESHHVSGDIDAAIDYYKSALKIRKERLEALEKKTDGNPDDIDLDDRHRPETEPPIVGTDRSDRKEAKGKKDSDTNVSCDLIPSALLDVAINDVKIADALRSMGKEDQISQAGVHFMSAMRALQRCRAMEASVASLGFSGKQRFEALESYLDSMY